MEEGNISERARFDFIRYANVWEDPQVLLAAFEDVNNKRILSIASSGDNCFALLAKGASVVAADINPAQIATTELKRQAILKFEHSDLLRFLGFQDSTDRKKRYSDLRDSLPAPVQKFWDANLELIESGVIHAGKFERYFQFFRQKIFPFVHSRKTVQALFTPREREEREQFYDTVWNSSRWRWVFKIFFSRFVMGRMGRDPEFFRYVEGSVGERILERAEIAFKEIDPAENPYLHYILTGNFYPVLPDCYKEEHYDNLRSGLSRLTLSQESIAIAGETHTGEGFDGYNLSDIFEYLDQETADAIYERMFAVANTGARFVYWNMLVPRERPESLKDKLRCHTEFADRLLRQDRACFYSKVHIEEVL